ncbi:MAG: hypothetical protein PUC21_10085 [Bacteroidales bacterium]|nr:hypothetical protein [Bacteroidales bacterium]
MENKVKVWLARDKGGWLWLYPTTPFKDDGIWFCNQQPITQLDSSYFPSVRWGDDVPTEAYITLAEPQPKQEQGIDWEQRRYEIAKEMLPIIYRHGMEAQKHGQSVKRKDTADFAVAFADVLISKLKNENK